MCIIVDANSSHELVNRSEDGLPVLRWLLNPKRRSGRIVGGQLVKELVKAGFADTLAVLSRAGRLHRAPDRIVDERAEALRESGSCVSNDQHVVALALETGCDIVFTKDKALHQDLKSHAPTGHRIAIYQRATHARLLRECRCP